MKSTSITESLAVSVKKYMDLGRTDKEISYYLQIPVSAVQRAKNGAEIINCSSCGKTFQKTARGQRYCSDECRQKRKAHLRAN